MTVLKLSSLKTNNSFVLEKVNLRFNHLPDKNPIFVLDCYAGKGVLWGAIQKKSDKTINVLSIDKIKHNNVDIHCDNLKVLAGINLSRFDVIDLDAYGCPFAQMQILFKRNYCGHVFVTYIQSGMGNLPTGILLQSGFTREMLAKAQTIFTSKPLQVLEQYLSANGIESYSIISLDRKHYLYFNTLSNVKGDPNEQDL